MAEYRTLTESDLIFPALRAIKKAKHKGLSTSDLVRVGNSYAWLAPRKDFRRTVEQ